MSTILTTIMEGKLPEVTIEEIHKGYLCAIVRDEHGVVIQWEVKRENIANARQCGIAALAVADRIQDYFDSEEYETKELQERRDALASVLHLAGATYSGLTPVSQRAVDRIIHLENELKASAK